jgi:hypothetical protein
VLERAKTVRALDRSATAIGSKPIENKSLHEIGIDNRGRIVDFVTFKDLIAESTVSFHSEIRLLTEGHRSIKFC